MRHITVRPTGRGMVAVDVTRDAEGLLDRLAALHSADPDIVDDLLGALGSALAFRDRSRADGDGTRATLAAAQAVAARDELGARMAAAGSSPVVAELSRQDAIALARDLTAAAGPHPAQGLRGVA